MNVIFHNRTKSKSRLVVYNLIFVWAFVEVHIVSQLNAVQYKPNTALETRNQ